MAESIELFQFIRRVYQIVGIIPSYSNPKWFLIESRKMIFLLGLTQYLISTAAYLIFEAKSMIEYAISFLFLIFVIDSVILYVIHIGQIENILKFIGNCEQFIKSSKWWSEKNFIANQIWLGRGSIFFLFNFFDRKKLNECI